MNPASLVNSGRTNSALSVHPLANVGRAMHDLHATSATRPQEPNHVHVHLRHFLQVECKLRPVFKKLFFQFFQMFRLKVANQIDRRFSALRTFLDPHCHSSLNCRRGNAMQAASQNYSLNGWKLRRNKFPMIQESRIFRKLNQDCDDSSVVSADGQLAEGSI
jgi:hypothetical protein